MNVLFDIQGSGKAHGGLLLCEWGMGYCALALFDSTGGTPHRLKYWSLSDPLPQEEADTVLESLRQLSTHAARVVVASAFPEAVAVPARYAGERLVPALYPQPDTGHEDRVAEWQLHIQYALPAPLAKALKAQLPAAEYYHVFTPALRNANGVDAASQLQAHFTPGQLRILARRDGRLQLAQMYRYETPMDAVYYLLRIAAETGLPGGETPLVLSGLIEEESALYRELHQYFANIRFAVAEGVSSEDGRPAHFFTSLYNLAQCVS